MVSLSSSRSGLASLLLVVGIVGSLLFASDAAAGGMPDLGTGDTGADVVALQTELTEKGFYRSSITGTYGPKTGAAVMALTKELGVSRSTEFKGSLWDDLSAYPGPWLPDRNEADRLEVNLTKQVMYLVRGGNVEAILPISSGRSGFRSPPGNYDLFYHRIGYIGGVAGYGTYSPWYYTTGLSVHGYHSVPSYPYSHGCIRVQYWDQNFLESRLYLGIPLHLWYEPAHYEKARLDAVAPAGSPDGLISYDRGTGTLTPLELLGSAGDLPGIVESGTRSSISRGFDIALSVTVDSRDILIYYDKGTGRLRYLEVSESGTVSTIYESTISKGWSHIVPGDYDGDNGSDLLFYRETDGRIQFLSIDLGIGLRAITGSMSGTRHWSQLVVGDYDADGIDDIMWYRASDGLMRFYSVGSDHVFQAMTPAMFGTRNWSLIPSGDFDGDGADDVLYYRDRDGLYRFYDVNTRGVFAAKSPADYMSPGWEQILPTDLDANSGVDLVFYQPGTITGARYKALGIGVVTEAMSAPSNQLLVSIGRP
jgi:N-acetylmuramoyl-L-alanine amidase